MVQTSQQQVLVAQVYHKQYLLLIQIHKQDICKFNLFLSLENTGTCDLNINHNLLSLITILLSFRVILLLNGTIRFSFWANIPYDVDNNGNVYGYWSPNSNSTHDSTGYEFSSGSVATIPVKLIYES